MISSQPSMRPQGRTLSIGITVACGLAFMLFGYDQGVFGGILSNPAFQEQFDHPDATIEGQIVSSYVLGCVIGAFISMFLGDRLGRRKSIGLACTLLTVGGVLQATAFTLPHIIVGRIVSGIGIGMNTTTVPMWQSETCEPKRRGILMSIQLTMLVFGFVVANWLNFGFTYIPDQPVAWRFPLAFQSVLAILTLAIVPFMVESPRWLCLRGRDDDALDVLARIAVKPSTDSGILQELRTIQQMISHENESQGSGWRQIFTNGPQQNFRRIALGAGANFMQQFGGINVVAYYLPVVLKRSFKFSDRMSLVLSAVDSMQWMFWAGMASFVIDRVGRRRLLIFGSAGQSLCFVMAAIGLAIDTKPMNGVAVAFIFLYYFFFGLSFLVIPFMYPSEINSHRTRNLGSAIAMVTNWLGVYVIVSVTPTALSTFNFACWIKPKDVILNQLLGVKSGMGLIPITFDWSQISYLGSPLLVPSWAILNIAGSLIFWIWIVAVACYYSNIWDSGYLPFQSSSVYDNTGGVYNATNIVSAASGYKLDVQKYLEYSPVYIPVTYALNMFGLSFATLAALLVWVGVEHRGVLITGATRLPSLVLETLPGRRTNRTKEDTDDVPMWWYLICTVLALFLSILAVEYWAVELRWYGVLLACAVALVFYTPLALIYATANLKINIDILCRIIAGLVFSGKTLANIWFFDIGDITTIKGLYFAQDMKLAYYCNIPQKALFTTQLTGILFGTLASLLTLNWSFSNISDICTPSAPNGFTCPYSRTHFNTSLIWGAIGPRRFFAEDYHALMYFPILGAALGASIYILRRHFPLSSLWRKVHIPLFLGGLNYLPPATGMNYASWVVVGLVFGWVVKRRYSGWWGKYNFVLSAALDTSVSVAGVVIFFAVFFSGASQGFGWWGTEVCKETCDYKGCPYLAVPEGGKFGV